MCVCVSAVRQSFDSTSLHCLPPCMRLLLLPVHIFVVRALYLLFNLILLFIVFVPTSDSIQTSSSITPQPSDPFLVRVRPASSAQSQQISIIDNRNFTGQWWLQYKQNSDKLPFQTRSTSVGGKNKNCQSCVYYCMYV